MPVKVNLCVYSVPKQKKKVMDATNKIALVKCVYLQNLWESNPCAYVATDAVNNRTGGSTHKGVEQV